MGTLPNGVGNADNGKNKAGFGPVGQVGGGTKVVVDIKIVEALTRAEIGDAEDVIAIWGPKR